MSDNHHIVKKPKPTPHYRHYYHYTESLLLTILLSKQIFDILSQFYYHIYTAKEVLCLGIIDGVINIEIKNAEALAPEQDMRIDTNFQTLTLRISANIQKLQEQYSRSAERSAKYVTRYNQHLQQFGQVEKSFLMFKHRNNFELIQRFTKHMVLKKDDNNILKKLLNIIDKFDVHCNAVAENILNISFQIGHFIGIKLKNLNSAAKNKLVLLLDNSTQDMINFILPNSFWIYKEIIFSCYNAYQVSKIAFFIPDITMLLAIGFINGCINALDQDLNNNLNIPRASQAPNANIQEGLACKILIYIEIGIKTIKSIFYDIYEDTIQTYKGHYNRRNKVNNMLFEGKDIGTELCYYNHKEAILRRTTLNMDNDKLSNYFDMLTVGAHTLNSVVTKNMYEISKWSGNNITNLVKPAIENIIANHLNAGERSWVDFIRKQEEKSGMVR